LHDSIQVKISLLSIHPSYDIHTTEKGYHSNTIMFSASKPVVFPDPDDDTGGQEWIKKSQSKIQLQPGSLPGKYGLLLGVNLIFSIKRCVIISLATIRDFVCVLMDLHASKQVKGLY